MESLTRFDYLIFDFDGTLVNLNVDWSEVRERLKLDSVDDIWNLPSDVQQDAWEYVTQLEMSALAGSPVNADALKILGTMDFAVLTNNSEATVQRFLGQHQITVSSDRVIGREWLAKSKKDFRRFSEAISYLLRFCQHGSWHEPRQVGYVGDADYELEYATTLGLAAIRVTKDGSLQEYLGDVHGL